MQFHKNMWWKNKEEISPLFHVYLDIHFHSYPEFRITHRIKVLSSHLSDDNSVRWRVL